MTLPDQSIALRKLRQKQLVLSRPDSEISVADFTSSSVFKVCCGNMAG